MRRSRQALRLVAEGLRPGAGGAEAALRRRRQADWGAALALANAHLVTPSLHVGLAEAGGLADLPAAVRDYLGLLHRCNAERNAALRRQARELVGALGDAGVPSLLLKGAGLLLAGCYADPGARMIRDIDVLVPARAVSRATTVLRALGYAPEAPHGGRHAHGNFTRPGDPGAVDLHWEVIDASYLLPAQEVWRRARAGGDAALELLLPSPTDAVLHTVLHAQIHHLGNFYRGALELRQLCDFATLARHYGDTVDWPLVARRMARHRLEVPLHAYALAAERLLALPWPLPDPPVAAAALHYRRCMVQLHLPLLQRLAIPWGNLRAAFAWHRMSALYDGGRPPLAVIRHAAQYLRKSSARAAVGRLFRAR